MFIFQDYHGHFYIYDYILVTTIDSLLIIGQNQQVQGLFFSILKHHS